MNNGESHIFIIANENGKQYDWYKYESYKEVPI